MAGSSSTGGPRGIIFGLVPVALLLVAGLAWRFAPVNAEAPEVVADYWEAEYFSFYPPQGMDPRLGTTPQTRPVLVRNDPEIDFDWGKDSPAPGIPADQFSVRWTRTVRLPEGVYRFRVRSDDGIRLYINDALRLDRWLDNRGIESSVDVKLSEGKHRLRLEYYENWGNALVQLGWEPIPEAAASPSTPIPTSTSGSPPVAATALLSPTPLKSSQGAALPTSTAAEVSGQAPPTGNLLVNAGFEDDSNGDGQPDGWTVSIPDGGFGLATGQAGTPEGKKVAVFQPSQKSFIVSQDVDAHQRQDYEFGARVNIPSTSGWFRLSLILIPLNDQGQPLAAIDQAGYTQATSGWVEVKKRITAPTYTSKLRVQIKADVMRATAYLDDLRLQAVSPSR